MEENLKAKYEQWLIWDKNEQTKKEIIDSQKYPDKLYQLLMERLKFGTAGLRANMGAGFSQMNDLTIIQTTQGFLHTCLKYNHSKGIIIGYDSRHNSSKWAKIVANIFHRAGVKVYLYSDCVPTPFVAYGIKLFQALCGVMITASHNPKNDNGYKVYWENGCQINTPFDSEIATDIILNLTPRDESWEYTDIEKHVIDPLQDVLNNYYDCQIKFLSQKIDTKIANKFRMVYTPMHGVGWIYAKAILAKFGFKDVICVKEQQERDPEFSTVTFPNPEEKGALHLAMQTADKNNIRIVMANDPDADRFAAAEKHNNIWKVFNGNELGTLFGWWIWSHYSKTDINKNDLVMLSSTVSSKILKTMADKEGFQFFETLTGFKWLGNKADDLSREGKTVMFAYEEAIGYMCSTQVLDKDGISALAVFAELSAQLYSEGTSLTDHLEKLNQKYGYHISNNGYLKSKSSTLTRDMFNDLRNWQGLKDTYPEYCGVQQFKIVKIRDLTTGYHSYEENNRLPSVSSNEMVTFTFSNNCTLTIRASGTEPKIKYYSEIIHYPNDKSCTPENRKDELSRLIELMKIHFYQKEKFGFTDS